MRRMVEKVLADHGTDMTVISDTGSKAVRGFFRAVRSFSWQSIEAEATLLGEITRGQYCYIGPADVRVREGDSIVVENMVYLVRRVELYHYRNEPIYLWAMCVEKGVNDIWICQS